MFINRSVVHNQQDGQPESISSSSNSFSSHDTDDFADPRDQLPSSPGVQPSYDVEIPNHPEDDVFNDQLAARSSSPDLPHEPVHPSTSNTDRLKVFRQKLLAFFELESPWLNNL